MHNQKNSLTLSSRIREVFTMRRMTKSGERGMSFGEQLFSQLFLLWSLPQCYIQSCGSSACPLTHVIFHDLPNFV